MKRPDWMRESEAYGDVLLSVQASDTHYSTPREPGLPLEAYSRVEIAVMVKPTPGNRSGMVLPSHVGIEGFDHLFEEGESPVAGYVTQEDVARLRDALRKRAEEVTP